VNHSHLNPPDLFAPTSVARFFVGDESLGQFGTSPSGAAEYIISSLTPENRINTFSIQDLFFYLLALGSICGDSGWHRWDYAINEVTAPVPGTRYVRCTEPMA